MRLTNRINTTLNTHTTIHTLFQHPTIADLANHLSEPRRERPALRRRTGPRP
ncbi:acyl carrier protein [Streptomyces sp. NPDC088246]|uniref:acyl carrier protein n=1 Tax=Streptomyces sp. NPDC088246 TaxID=3365842 RepID=UPI00383074A5